MSRPFGVANAPIAHYAQDGVPDLLGYLPVVGSSRNFLCACRLPMARPDASLVSVGRWTPTQSTMRTGGGPDQHDTGRVPSRRPIVTKFSVRQQIDPGSRPAEFGERGSIDADVVNYAYDGGPDDCPAVVSRDHGTDSLASRRPICLRFSGKITGMQKRLSAKFCACC